MKGLDAVVTPQEWEAWAPDPPVARVRIERWLASQSQPELTLQSLATFPLGREAVVRLLGASEYWTQVFVQNPELGTLVLSPEEWMFPITTDDAHATARRLVGASVSYSHRLDRLRYVKQRGVLRCLVHDLTGIWSPPKVWAALSELAEGLVRCAAEVVWEEVRERHGVGGEFPVAIVAYGKLGGHELNLSSDIDLVYVIPDDLDEATENVVNKTLVALGRALSDRMGRGALYRVDTRLRPFGRSGPLCMRWRAVESYFKNHAEPWEQLAMIRSRVIFGTQEEAERWQGLRQAVVFRPARGEWVVDELMQMRVQLDNFKGDNDLKRSPGGIRDIEFSVQMLQLLHGYGEPALQGFSTLDVLGALAELGLLKSDEPRRLAEAYVFFRQIEHRLQMGDDLQTHVLPAEDAAWTALARSMNEPDGAAFRHRVERTRVEVRELYLSILGRRGEVAGKSPWPREADPWLGALSGEGWAESLRENRDSLTRVTWLARMAPVLMPYLGQDPVVSEWLISGEFEEMKPRMRDGSAPALRRAWLLAACRALLLETSFGEEWSEVLDEWFFAHKGGLEVIALGSFAGRNMGLFSDCDLWVWGQEVEAEQLVARVQAVRQAGAPLNMDLRLRPEGRSGPLASSVASFRKYRTERLETWERMALSRARPIGEAPQALPEIEDLLAPPLTGEEFEELLAMKHRIETERVPAHHWKRHLRHSAGGTDDVEWLVHLAMMKEPAWRPPVANGMQAELASLENSRILVPEDVNELRLTYRLWQRLRMALACLAFDADVVPENPDKLDALAEVLKYETGNDLLRSIQQGQADVRRIFDKGVRRLQEW